jgi:Ca2+-transporting ATPase
VFAAECQHQFPRSLPEGEVRLGSARHKVANCAQTRQAAPAAAVLRRSNRQRRASLLVPSEAARTAQADKLAPPIGLQKLRPKIARAIGLQGWEATTTGDEVMKLSEAKLRKTVKTVNVFARMFPEAKLRVVNALKANGEVVAMSGDGVNDGPALKAAHIGVAMGKSGTEIAKSAASLVLLNDNLDAMATAIRMGRRIYDNLRKAIRYIISIHLPIVLVVLVPLLFGWPYAHMLLPLHVIFLELVMDPTAAIAFENEPAEPNLMQKPPRPSNTSLFSGKELAVSLLQGVMITVGVFSMYHIAIGQGKNEEGVRSVVFATLVSANLFLALANRSFDYAFHRTLFYKNLMLPVILGVSVLMLLAILYVPFLTHLFKMGALPAADLGWCVLAGFGSVAWFEVWKALKSD